MSPIALPLTLAAMVLLNLVSSYTFIHLLLGTAVVCVLARLVYGPRVSETLPEDSCAPLADSGN